MDEVFIECARALLVFFIVLFLWRAGQDKFQRAPGGWNCILGGFSLILLGSIFDITDNFPGLNKFVVIGNTEVEAFIENVVGFLGGFVLLAMGLLKSAPSEKNMSRLIASHERTEKALRESEGRFQAVVNHSPTKIHIKDTEGRCLMVNREAEKLFGVADEEAREIAETSTLLKMTFECMNQGISILDADLNLVAWNQKYLDNWEFPSDFIYEGISCETISRFKVERGDFGPGDPEEIVARRGKEKQALEVLRQECVLPNGSVISVVAQPMPNGGYVTTHTDITEQKRYETELLDNLHELEDSSARYELQGQEMAGLAERISFARDEADRANKAKSEFLTTMNHELRTPLNAVIGFSEIIKGERLGPVGVPEYREYATDIFDAGHHLLKLINDLLNLSRIEAGKFELDEKDFSVVQVMQSCLRLLKERAQKGNLEILPDIPETLPMLHFDELKFKQVILNLLSNAVKFTPEDGRVTVKAWSEPERGYFFQVIDTGIGVAPEDIPKAFSSFGQIDSQLAKRYEGSGLGLPISKALIELGGGVLEMQSKVGQGTTMTIKFPKERIVQNPPVKALHTAAE